MSTPQNQPGELPEDLAHQILRLYGEDPLSDLPAMARISEATPGQIAAMLARQTFDTGWHGRMNVSTRDQIRRLVEIHFTPKEGPGEDFLAESAQRNHDATDAWQREIGLHEPAVVSVIRGAGAGVRITRTDGDHDEAA